VNEAVLDFQNVDSQEKAFLLFRHVILGASFDYRNNFYVKHNSLLEATYVSEFNKILESECHAKGLLQEKDKLKILFENTSWSEDQEEEYQEKLKRIHDLEISKKKLVIPFQIKSAQEILNKEIANVTRTLGTLLGNGVSILSAFMIVRETVDNLHIADALDDTGEQIKQGKTLFDALEQKSIFPKMAMQMIKMGEETGHLEEMLLRIATIYDKQLRVSITRMLALLEPALIITLGIMIAGIIVSILLAILSVNDLAV